VIEPEKVEEDKAPPPTKEKKAPITNELIRPEAPKTFQDAGISARTLEGLILKLLKQKGQMTVQAIADFLHVPLGVIDDIVRDLRDLKIIDTLIPLHYDLVGKGRELVRDYEREDAYLGPAPVPFEAYCEMVLRQAAQEKRITMDDLRKEFEGFPIREDYYYVLKEGFNSQRSLLFYGPPGNGKTLFTDRLHNLLKRPVVLPYAFEFNNRVVRLYDPSYHKTWDTLMERERRESTPSPDDDPYQEKIYRRPDERWLICHAPSVVVGTEFRVEHFEVSYDGVYDAPPHVKANNGIFIFDDLGRQAQDHNLILNQFIYPLESQEAIVKFGGGSSLRVPYKQRLFLSPNLDKEEIIDDAFKRHLLYQILVDRPTPQLFIQIFHNEARKAGMRDEDAIKKYGQRMLEWYEQHGRVLRACDPRNFFVMINAALDEGQTIDEILEDDLFERIYWQYPAGLHREEKSYHDERDEALRETRERKAAEAAAAAGGKRNHAEIFSALPAARWRHWGRRAWKSARPRLRRIGPGRTGRCGRSERGPGGDGGGATRLRQPPPTIVNCFSATT